MKHSREARLCVKCSQDGPDPLGALRLQWDSEGVTYPVNLSGCSRFRLNFSVARVVRSAATLANVAPTADGFLPSHLADASSVHTLDPSVWVQERGFL
jgi:hypothetical protein